MSKVILESWEPIFPEGGTSYAIFKGDGKYFIQASMFLKESTGNPNEDQVVDIPLQKAFNTAHDAFEWLEENFDMFAMVDPTVYIIGDDGQIIAEWTIDALDCV